ncbi:unnamed protein product, partial [Didymodactylos carnosus]
MIPHFNLRIVTLIFLYLSKKLNSTNISNETETMLINNSTVATPITICNKRSSTELKNPFRPSGLRFGFGTINQIQPSSTLSGGLQLSDDAPLGLSVGGSKDINIFRQNIRNKYLPVVTDLTYEGLFYDYFFHTSNSDNNQSVCQNLFCPTYSMATVYNNSFSEP